MLSSAELQLATSLALHRRCAGKSISLLMDESRFEKIEDSPTCLPSGKANKSLPLRGSAW